MTLEILNEVACIINNYMIINDTSGVVNDATISLLRRHLQVATPFQRFK